MNRSKSLARDFLDRVMSLGGGQPPPESSDFAELDTCLWELFDAGRAEWPNVHVDATDFVVFLARHASDPIELRRLHIRDLYLACACATGDPIALAAFDRCCLCEVDAALLAMRFTPEVRDETKQVLRRRFFVDRPRIAEYSGRGPLKSWVRAAAVRVALRVVRPPKGHVALDSTTLRVLAAPSDDLELSFLKQKHGEDFRRALNEAFGLLAPRERNILRYYFGEGLNVDQLATLYHVHRATAARWVGRASATLVAKTRAILRRQLRATSTEVSSILRLVQSQLETTLREVIHSLPLPS